MSITRFLIELTRPTPKRYRRSEFREYVASLPMSESMAIGTVCPIATYMKIDECGRAADMDPTVASYLDHAIGATGLEEFWTSLTPLAVLDAIDVVDEQERFAADAALRGLTPDEYRLRLEARVVETDLCECVRM